MQDYREFFQQLPEDRVLMRGASWSLDCGSFFLQSARALEQIEPLKLQPGSRVGVYACNSISYLFLLWALWSRGLVAVLINRRWPKEQAHELAARLDCQAVFEDGPSDWTRINQEIPICEMPPVVHGRVPAGFTEGYLPLQPPDLSRPATIMLTTGSTGVPKAFEHSLMSHILNAEGSNANIAFGPGDTWLLSLGLYHVGGLSIFFRALLGGGAVCICNRPEKTLHEVDGITHLSAVPTQLGKWLHDPELLKRLQSMKAILLGGAAAPESLIGDCASFDLPLYTTYGSTEMASQITTTARHDTVRHWHTSGKVLSHRKLTIDGKNRILVGGPVLFSRMLSIEPGRPDQDAPEWYRTGDLGTIDEAGYLHVLGREDNMFTSGGENISPEEVEFAIMELPGVLQVIVVPVRSEEFGHRPAAFVQWTSGFYPDLPALCARLERSLARYKIPDYCLPWPDDPPTRGGKLDRNGFRIHAERLIELHGQKLARK